MARPLRSPPSPSPTGRPRALGPAGLIVVVAVFLALALPLLPCTVDDAWITFRYAWNWAHGPGPYFNSGEHVEGYSNFLLMALLTPVVALGGATAALPAAKAIGLVSALAMLLGAWAVARSLAGATKSTAPAADVAGVVAAGLLACAPGFALNAVNGLETTLFGALVVWGTYGFATGRPRAGATGLALAALTRPEGPLVFAVCWLLVVVDGLLSAKRIGDAPRAARPARDWLVSAAIGAGVVGAHLLFRRLFYDGEWVPNTYFAKLGGSGDRLDYVLRGALPPVLGWVGALLALAGWAAAPRSARAALVAGGVALLGCLLPLYTGGDWMYGHRLIVPYLPLLLAVAAVGWLRLASRLAQTRPRLVPAILLAMLPVAWITQHTERSGLTRDVRLTATGARTGHAALGDWLATASRPGDAVVLMDIGQIGYRLREQRIVDVTGLTDRHIARSPGTFMAKRFDLDYVFRQRPRWIVLSFLASGEPYAPIAPGQAIHPFSEMEEALVSHPAFAGWYGEAPEPAVVSGDELEELASRLHARRVFRSAAPGHHYLLAVYERE